MTEVYIVTPNFGANFLPNYFKSLANQTHKDFKIVFVDNTIGNEAVEYIDNNCGELNLNMKIIKNKTNNTFTKTTNQGIYEALKDKECKYIISLNNDVYLDKNFVKELVLCAKKHPDAGSIQSLMLWGDTNLIDNVGVEYSKNGLGFGRGAYEKWPCKKYSKEEEILGCCAGACLYVRDALENMEFKSKKGKMIFDEEFGSYYEDFDIAFRLQWFGYKAYYNPKAIVKHYKNIKSNKMKIYYSARNYTLTLHKNMPRKFIWKNIVWITLTEIIQIAFNLIKLKPIVLKAKFDAYKTIFSKMNPVEKKVDFKNIEKWITFKWRV